MQMKLECKLNFPVICLANRNGLNSRFKEMH